MFAILDKWPHKLAHTNKKVSKWVSINLLWSMMHIHQNHGLRFVNLATSCRGAELSWKTSSWCQCHKLRWNMQTDRRTIIANIHKRLLVTCPFWCSCLRSLGSFWSLFSLIFWSSCDNCDSVRLCWFLLPFESWLQCSAGRYDITPLFGAGLILLFYLNMIAVRDLGEVVRFKFLNVFFATYALDIGWTSIQSQLWQLHVCHVCTSMLSLSFYL